MLDPDPYLDPKSMNPDPQHCLKIKALHWCVQGVCDGQAPAGRVCEANPPTHPPSPSQHHHQVSYLQYFYIIFSMNIDN